MMTWKTLMFGPFNVKWVLMLILANKLRKLFSVTNQSGQPTHLQFSTIIILETLGCYIRFKINIWNHLNNVLATFRKAVGLLGNLWNLLPRTTLVTIYKAFGHLWTRVMSCMIKLFITWLKKQESIQYNAYLALTRTIWGIKIGHGVPPSSTLMWKT